VRCARQGKGGRSRDRRKTGKRSDGQSGKGPAPGPPWEVRWHPRARAEAQAIKKKNTGDYDSVITVIEKLKALCPMLRYPHQSGVKGKTGGGLRELRPGQGRTLWRPLYRRFGDTYVILAVGPEAQVDQTGFNSAVKDAQARRGAIEKAEGQEKDPDSR